MHISYLTAASLLCFGTAGLAQSYITSPPGFDNIEGETNASIGGYPDGRFQYVDGDLRGKAMTVTGMAYRHDNLLYVATSQGMGRSWTNVTVDMSECDINNLTSTFTKNPTTTPTRVRSSAVTWPTQDGKPGFLPAKFNIVFPFTTNWVYTGKMDICADQVYTGGTLANSGAWASTTWSYYYIDGVNPATYAYTTSNELGEGGYLKGCDDRNSANLYGAQVSSSLYYYSKSYPNAYAGNLVFNQTGNYFGPNTLVITFLGIKSAPSGWTLPGIYCNKVYLDPSFILASIYQSSTNTGSLPQLGLGGTYGIPAPAGVSGTEIVTQATWRDTKNGMSMLSSAAVLRIPKAPTNSKHNVIFHYNPTAVNGFGPQTSNANGIVRYSR